MVLFLRPVSVSEALANYKENVQRFRTHREMSVNELARASDISVPQLRNIERGDSKGSFEAAIRIANALGVGVDDLIQPWREPLSEDESE